MPAEFFRSCFLLLGFLCLASLSSKAQKTYFYMGEISVKSPEGINYGKYVALTKQTINRKDRSILMEVKSIDQKGEVKDYNYTIRLTKSRLYHAKFALTDNEGNYSGTGKYKGFKWLWFKWRYQINYTNPVGKMVGKDRVRLSGLIVKKKFYGADGKASLIYYEKHKPVSKEVYEILYLQILK